MAFFVLGRAKCIGSVSLLILDDFAELSLRSRVRPFTLGGLAEKIAKNGTDVANLSLLDDYSAEIGGFYLVKVSQNKVYRAAYIDDRDLVFEGTVVPIMTSTLFIFSLLSAYGEPSIGHKVLYLFGTVLSPLENCGRSSRLKGEF